MGEAEHHLCKKATEGLHHGQQRGKTKPKLVVEVSSVRSASYKEIIQKNYKKIKEENLSRQETLTLRGELC